MKKSILLSMLLVVIVTVSVTAQSSLYKKAGVIKIIDNKALAAGTIRADKNVFTISLEDVGKYDGHICGCNTAGFIITKNVLKKLYPSEIPSRNSMNIKISGYTQDLIDAIEFITGNRLDGGKYQNKPSDFEIDPSLAKGEGIVKIVFERKDNGKKIQVVMDKSILLSKEEMTTIKTIKPKMGKKIATKAEKQKFTSTTQNIVKKEITNLPKGAIVYTELN